jgi:dihydroxy-acid dehydratase
MASNNDPLHEHVAALNVQDESTKDPDPSSNKNSGTSPNHNPDYDLSTPIPSNSTGLRQSLPSYGDAHFSLFLRKAFIKSLGYTDASLSLPIIGIANTFSAFNPCHANVPQLLEAVKRGVLMAGGLPMEFPTVSLHEAFAGGRSSMFLRNLMAMDTEEMVRGQPVDAVVLIGGW